MQTERIPLTELEPNTGQIPGLPMNPRQWTKSDVERIARSLKDTPELFEARPIIAVPFDGKYVILGGNLRYEGARHNGDADAPVCVLPADMPTDKMKEIVVKDNGNFGAWDVDSLANEWSDLDLEDWGVPEWITGNAGKEIDLTDLGIDTSAGVGESITGMQSITFLFQNDDAELVKAWIDAAGKDGKEILAEKIVELCRDVEAK